jgi:type IV fimbrial biogenesis protein FimT
MQNRQRGVTLVELMIAITVAAILLALAMPSYTDIRNKRAVTGAAEQVSTFMALGRSEAVKRNIPVSVRIDNSGTDFCVGLTSAATCDCFETDTTSASFCQIDDGGQTTRLALSAAVLENVQMPPVLNSTPLLLTFDPIRGVLDTANDTTAQVLFTSENDNYALRVDVNISGRVEICSPADKKVPGYQACG